MNSIANKYNLLSLKTDAKNSIKDGSASVIGFFSVFIASQFGILQMDAIGGMIIARHIFSIIYFPQAIITDSGRLVAEPQID